MLTTTMCQVFLEQLTAIKNSIRIFISWCGWWSILCPSPSVVYGLCQLFCTEKSLDGLCFQEEFLVKPEKEEVSAQPPTNKNEGNVLRNPFSDSSESSFDEAEELSVVKKPPIKSYNDNARQDSSDSSDDETPLAKNPIFSNKDKVHQISSSESSDDEGSVDSDIQRYIESASPEPVAKGSGWNFIGHWIGLGFEAVVDPLLD